MGNNLNTAYRFSKINNQIKLVVLWISLIILFSYTDISFSLHSIIRYSPNAEKYYRIKSILMNTLSFLNISKRGFYEILGIIELLPVFVILLNIFIKKKFIDYINIIAGFILLITCIIILIHKRNSMRYSSFEVIICIIEILILFLIIFKSIQKLIINQVNIENNQNNVLKFNKINIRIKLIVLWVSIILLYNYITFTFDSFLELIRFSPIAGKISHNIFLKSQELNHQLLMDHIHGKEFDHTKFLIIDILNFINDPPITYFTAEFMIKLTPVLIILSNLYIKKNINNYINIIAGFIYVMIVISTFFYNSFYGYIVIYIFSVVEILMLGLIITLSIQDSHYKVKTR
jgi:hypothetical protein